MSEKNTDNNGNKFLNYGPMFENVYNNYGVSIDLSDFMDAIEIINRLCDESIVDLDEEKKIIDINNQFHIILLIKLYILYNIYQSNSITDSIVKYGKDKLKKIDEKELEIYGTIKKQKTYSENVLLLVFSYTFFLQQEKMFEQHANTTSKYKNLSRRQKELVTVYSFCIAIISKHDHINVSNFAYNIQQSANTIQRDLYAKFGKDVSFQKREIFSNSSSQEDQNIIAIYQNHQLNARLSCIDNSSINEQRTVIIFLEDTSLKNEKEKHKNEDKNKYELDNRRLFLIGRLIKI